MAHGLKRKSREKQHAVWVEIKLEIDFVQL